MTVHRMMIIDSLPNDPRPRYRGTGFCLEPGGLTAISALPGFRWKIDERGILLAERIWNIFECFRGR